MTIRNQNWYNLQSTRRYPLDDSSTGDDDRGITLRDDILVDCNIRFPETFGRYLYIQAMTISPGIVTVVFGAARQLQSRDGTPIAAITLPRPVTAGINYSISALVPGVAGWVVFGHGTDTLFSAQYSTPHQSLIAARCSRAYPALPVQALSKFGLAATLDNVITITAGAPVVARYAENLNETYINAQTGETGTVGKAIVFGLDQSGTTDAFNPLRDFLGPCGQRPESGTCDQTPIETINGVAPDCDGNIEITFAGLDARTFIACGGIDILTDVGLQDACGNIPDPKKEFVDLCCQNEDGTPRPDEFCFPDPVPELVVEEIVSPNQPCLEFPICLNSCDATAHFNTVTGAFSTALATAPPPPATGIITPNDLSEHYLLAALPSGTSIAILKNCPTDWSAHKKITAVLQLTGIGPARNGGIVLNYNSTPSRGRVRRNYTAVLLDGQANAIRVLRFNNDIFVEEHAIPLMLRLETWYALSVSPVMNTAESATLNIVVLDMLTGMTVTGTATVAEYGAPTGYQGLIARQAYTYFNNFDIA